MALPISFELATVLRAVSVGGGCDSSGRCSTFSSVSLSLEGVRVTSGRVPSSILSGVNLDVSSMAMDGSWTTSSAIGGMGNSSA